jgi:hypothetical protein
MGKRKGPPYSDPDDCKYIVVANPWGMNQAGSRGQRCVNNLGAWLNRMFDRMGTADVVYMRDKVSLGPKPREFWVFDALDSQTQ